MSTDTIAAYFETELGRMLCGDALEVLPADFDNDSINLIVTSPPFGLVRKKDYGNVDAPDYVEWFKPFGEEFKRVLRPDGSLVIDIGGAWVPGQPTRSLYHFKLLIMLCEELGFHLAQEFYWWNPSKLPTPAEWVNIRRVRVKDAVNCIWWLSPTPWPRANNRRILQPYSKSMKDLLKNGYKAKKRPSGHDISKKFAKNNRAAIPPNLLAISNTDSNSYYLRYCKEHNLQPHPARFPLDIPAFFIRMLTDPGDSILDPFAGSCVTGEACEILKRKWSCIDLVSEYLETAKARFHPDNLKNGTESQLTLFDPSDESNYYQVYKPGLLADLNAHVPLPEDGGRKRPDFTKKGRGGPSD